MNKMSFKIHGMDCADEIATLKRELRSWVRREEDLSFNLLDGRMTILPREDSVSEKAIEDAVARTGMRAVSWKAFSTSKAAPERAAFWQQHGRAIACLSSGFLMILGLLMHLLGRGGLSGVFSLGEDRPEGVLASALVPYLGAVIAGGWYIVPKALLAARKLRPDMNLLMTAAVLGAMLIGEWFEAAAVTFLFSLALLLEAWSVGRARRAIKSLLDLSPPTAVALDRESGHATERPVVEIPVGSTIVVRPGEKIPLDGILTKGSTTINQAPITGESLPVSKTIGDEVYAGTINGDGAIEFRSSKLAADTTVARIITMVEEAQSRRAPSEQWVERFARYYTPAMMALAVLIGVLPPLLLGGSWSAWFYQALVLLVIACPCALVISTPVSIVAALAAAAKSGVLVKGGRFLEKPGRLRAMALDKTGTLTEGCPEVGKVLPLNGHTEGELLEIAAAIESRSEHPLARAIVRYASALGIHPGPAENYRAIQGKGASAEIAGRPVWIGSHRYLEERAQEDSEMHDRLVSLSAGGASVVVIGNNEHVCGFIALADKVRPTASGSIAALKKTGIAHTVMLTGDNRETAESVGRETGIDEVRAELLPEDKVRAVEELVGRYGAVAMTGDGVNDAPAMARASIGIAMGAAGSDAALETADVALMSDDLSRLPWLVRHSRRTLRIIKQNVAAAIAVKALFVLLAFAGHASLWAAIGADMGISLAVVLNALRLLGRAETDEGASPGFSLLH